MNASHPAVGPGQSYRPIEDYAVLGDGLTAVLVAPDASIDWACFPRFDSPSVFVRLLDARRGGCWRIELVAPYRVRRRYLPDTNVLETTFTTAEGEAALLDVMPPCYGRRDRAGASTVVRVLRGQGGRLPFRVVFDPRFDYARAEPTWTVQPGCGAVAAHGGADLTLLTRVPLAAASSGGVAGDGVVQAGEEVPFILAWREPPRHFWPSGLLARASDVVDETATFWRAWIGRCAYRGPCAAAVRRSALALKLLDYAPTGAIVAAPTTSLPEEIGGVRNWDYRYSWLRDTAFTIHAFYKLGYHVEPEAFLDWMLDVAESDPARLRSGNPVQIEQVWGHATRAVAAWDGADAVPPPRGEEVPLVAPQLEALDEGRGQEAHDGPVEFVQLAHVDGLNEVFGRLGHGFSSRLVSSTLPDRGPSGLRRATP